MPLHIPCLAFIALQLHNQFETGHAQADGILRQEVEAFIARTVESTKCSQLRPALRCDMPCVLSPIFKFQLLLASRTLSLSKSIIVGFMRSTCALHCEW